ncbi:MAG: His/Gly/Thr/Pro-type tRNA ligase C-terminal domain-containing protein [Chloroflexi bacterium]|nr:His/Gly/Thr/Pro-type tRNA ligase C-terminal domain-containing protein [Chloroflexota bacterium]
MILYLNSIGCTKCRPIYLETLKSYYATRAAMLCEDCKKRMIKNPLRLLDCKNETCLPLIKQAPKITDYLCEECSNHFILLKKYLDILVIPYNINHALVRGLDYYTKTVFEIQPKSEKGAQAAVGGGGRYDDLIQLLGGPPTPGIGFATGLERIVMNLKKQNITAPSLEAPDVFIAYLGQAAKESSLKLVRQLREKGNRIIQSYGNRSLKSQLRQASTLQITYTIIIGEEELKNNSVILRDMKQGTQQSVSNDNLLNILKNSGG